MESSEKLRFESELQNKSSIWLNQFLEITETWLTHIKMDTCSRWFINESLKDVEVSSFHAIPDHLITTS